MDGCPRQNPAYRPAKGKPRSGGAFLCPGSPATRPGSATGRPAAIAAGTARRGPPDVALDKLGARGISVDEAGQLARNRHVTARNAGAADRLATRRLLIGRTDGGRALTLVIERTVDPATWLIVTGWSSTDVERKLLGS